MAHEISVTVPLPLPDAMRLLLRAAEDLHHHVPTVDIDTGRALILADFSLRSLSTFRIEVWAEPVDWQRTRLRLRVGPGFKLALWTGFGQSQRAGWRLVGKMQSLYDPARYGE